MRKFWFGLTWLMLVGYILWTLLAWQYKGGGDKAGFFLAFNIHQTWRYWWSISPWGAVIMFGFTVLPFIGIAKTDNNSETITRVKSWLPLLLWLVFWGIGFLGIKSPTPPQQRQPQQYETTTTQQQQPAYNPNAKGTEKILQEVKRGVDTFNTRLDRSDTISIKGISEGIHDMVGVGPPEQIHVTSWKVVFYWGLGILIYLLMVWIAPFKLKMKFGLTSLVIVGWAIYYFLWLNWLKGWLGFSVTDADFSAFGEIFTKYPGLILILTALVSIFLPMLIFLWIRKKVLKAVKKMKEPKAPKPPKEKKEK